MKKRELKKVFGEEENKKYRKRRNTYFIIIAALFLIAYFFRRYFNFLTNIKYLELVNIASLVGLAIAIFSFHLLDKSFNINFKKRHYFFVYFMSVTGILFSFLYFKYTHYDKVEHFFFPMMFASIAYYMLKSKLDLSLFWRLFFTFSIIVGGLSIFELLEYFLDIFFGWRLQGVFIENPAFVGGYQEILARIDDTMIDIGLGVIGTLIYIFTITLIEKKAQLKKLK